MTAICLRNLGELDPASSLGNEWDRLVSDSNDSGFMQSTHWAKFKRQMGYRILHLGLFADDQLFGGAVFYTGADNKGAGFLVAPDGPVLPWSDTGLTEHSLKLLLEATRDQARELGVMAIRIAPRLAPPKPDVLQGFARAPVSLSEHKTLTLNLQSQSEELLQFMKPKGRYNIGLAQRKGVSIREDSSLSAAISFYSVMREVSTRDRFFVEPLSYFIGLIETLCPAGLARILFAEHDADILGALLMVTFGDRATYLSGGTTSTKRNFMGGYALQWAAIKAAKESGCKVYDFWGFDPTVAPEHSYAGFSRFKSQFGGDVVNLIGTYDFYFMDHLADVVIRAMKEVDASEPATGIYL